MIESVPQIVKEVGKHMSRARYQRPRVHRSGKRRQFWKAHWFTYDSDGKRHHHAATFGPTTTTTRQQAQQACDERVQRETSGTPSANADLTLAQLINDIYLPLKTRWSPNTRLGFMSAIRCHILPQLGDLRLKDLNKITLQKHLIRLAGEYGADLLKRVRTILHSALEEAVENDYLSRNPCRRLQIPSPKTCAPHRSLTAQEVTRLFASLGGEDRLLLRVLILTGARIGEALALKHDDLQDGAIRFDESALFGKAGPTKNRKTRTVPIPRSLQVELRHWLDLRLDDGPLVFPSKRGTMMRREGRPLAILRRARQAAGIPDLDFRMCRRTFSTLIEADLKDVQDMLGHHDAALTLAHYKRPIPERQRAAVEALDQKFSIILNTIEHKSQAQRLENIELQ